ncbi:hypothetical protein ACFONL_01145 [Camelimonas fluminis]|uniref:SPW repeat-containing protein n=1 Tax=Camelimonas fluminis TaxID=1576911 RepID=A0ABV7UCC9_9HYPH|nr:hypothetical protein [Camelimonas fluminis]
MESARWKSNTVKHAPPEPNAAPRRFSKWANIATLTATSTTLWWALHVIIFWVAPVSIWAAILMSSTASIIAVLITRRISGARLRPHLLLASTTAITFAMYISVAVAAAYERGDTLERSLVAALVLAGISGLYALSLVFQGADAPQK